MSEEEIVEIVNQMMDTARNLISLADEGDLICEDDGRHVFFGVVRDCAYKILTEAERESYSTRLRYLDKEGNGRK